MNEPFASDMLARRPQNARNRPRSGEVHTYNAYAATRRPWACAWRTYPQGRFKIKGQSQGYPVKLAGYPPQAYLHETSFPLETK